MGELTPDDWLDAHVFVGGCHYKGPDMRGIVSAVAARQQAVRRSPMRAAIEMGTNVARSQLRRLTS